MTLHRNPLSSWSARLLARLARRDLWPRKWWWPPRNRVKLTPENTEDCVRRHGEISSSIRFSMIGLIGFSFFCGLTLAVPDSVVLTGAGKIPVPFANTEIDFGTFIVVGPLLLVAYTLYLHIFVGQLLKLSEVQDADRTPAIFNLHGQVPAFLSYLAFYWLAPATVLAFAVQAAPLKAGTWLYFLAALFLIVLLMLQLRRHASPRRWTRALLWLLVAAVAVIPARVLWWSIDGGERPFERPWRLSQADLSNANLVGARLERADLERANLQGANLTRAHLRGADFSDADLSGAVLQGADLRGADLGGAKLQATDLRHANLRYARVGNTDLGTAEISRDQLGGLCFDTSTVFAEGTRPQQAAEPCRGGTGSSADAALCAQWRSAPPASCDRSVIASIDAPASGYLVECLRTCDPYYVDRDSSHTLGLIPRELGGGAWIKTTNTGDKNETAEDFLRFTIDPPATVYVGYDSRVVRRGRSALATLPALQSPPDWLVHGFELTDLVIELNEPDPDQDFVVYRKLFTGPQVVLGGNQAAGAEFDKVSVSNYVVVVKRAASAAK